MTRMLNRRHASPAIALLGLLLVLALGTFGCSSSAEEPGEDTGTANGSATESDDAVSDAEEPAESSADNLCGHPYFPIAEDLVLTYTQEAPGASSEMTVDYEITGDDTFVVHQTITGSGETITVDGEWECTDEGLVQTSNIGIDIGVPGVEFSDLEYSGVTLPPAEEFVEGATWQSTYTASGSASVEGVTLTYDVEIVQDNTLVTFESVTVPAGTFEAARVESTETLNLGVGGTATPGPATSTTIWYAKDVGIVKIVTEEAGGTFVQELVSTS